MRHLRRQQEHFARTDGDIDPSAVLHGPEHHVALHLEEEFLARIVMEIGSRIGTADRHDDECAVLKQQFIAHRRLEQMAVLVDPPVQVERGRDWHAFIIAMPGNFVAIGLLQAGGGLLCAQSVCSPAWG